MLYSLVNSFIKRKYKFLSDEDVKQLCISIVKICRRNNLNIANIKYLSHGEASLAMECDGMVIKFLPIKNDITLTNYLSNSNYILQPLDEELLQIKYPNGYSFKFSIILEEKVYISDNISTNDVVNFANCLYRDGYIWLDINRNNLGIDSNGYIKLIDYGQLFNKRYDSYYSSRLSEFWNDLEEFKKSKAKK